MRLVGCRTCKNIVQIGGALDEVTFLLRSDESFRCITPLCRGRMVRFSVSDVSDEFEVTELPVHNFFRAVNGFGTGVGAPASVERLKELLLTKRIVEVIAEPVGKPERTIVRELIMENGSRLHFETSSRGACVYYIEEPGPSCMEVVENELADAGNENSSSNREETGRDDQAGEGTALSDPPLSVSSGANELPNTERVPPVSEAGDLPAGGVLRPSGSDND